MTENILFLTLKIFATTGGIEKVSRVVGKSVYEFGIEENVAVQVLSMHDKHSVAYNNLYFPTELYKGYGVRKFRFMARAIWQGRKSRVILMSHVNLLLAGWLIKLISPKARVVLLAHGIEVWGKMNPIKRRMLQCCDEIISVSEFTRQQLVHLHKADPKHCSVINNCLDPFLPLPQNVAHTSDLRKRYGFAETDKILFTLSRLSARERYKGYDMVMEALTEIDKDVKYLIAGSYDQEEKEFIESLIRRFGLEGRVILAGYVAEAEVAQHFAISDCYVMPSVKEGFGIVFIEAMYYNVPVIAGNSDGSVDALRNGEFGLLVDPLNVEEIREGIRAVLSNPDKRKPTQAELLKHFGYDAYKIKINKMLKSHLGLSENPAGRSTITPDSVLLKKQLIVE
jgi:phosphatidyl-myo-inositol dimannoside synthase